MHQLLEMVLEVFCSGSARADVCEYVPLLAGRVERPPSINPTVSG